MQYFIDGNNLLHKMHALARGPDIGRERLCQLVAGWAHDCGANVTLFFDGREPHGGLAQQMRSAGITVVFSGDRTADDLIESHIAAAAVPAEITVITSDRAIQHEVRYRKANTIESQTFAAMLCPSDETMPPPDPAPPEKPSDIPEDETRQWIELFGEGAEGLADDVPPWER